MAFRAALLVYRGLALLAWMPLLGWLWWRGRKDPDYRLRWNERLGHIDVPPVAVGGVLVHCASVGEAQAAQPLIAALLGQLPPGSLSVSCQTPTGAATLRRHWGDAVQHLYLPLDQPFAVSRFLDRLQPRLVLLLERELWPELLHQLRQREVPVALVNARLSPRSAAGYGRFKALMSPVWSRLAMVGAVDADSAKLFAGLGVPPTALQVLGNLKFDVAPGPVPADLSIWLAALAERPMLVAGSTHPGEDEALLDAWPLLQTRHPDAVLVLVPRHPERFDAVARLLDQRALPWRRRSEATPPDAHTQVVLVDRMGELPHWYAPSRLCFIGGTLVPVGGHNPLEALGLGKPILFGPHTHNAASLFREVQAAGAGMEVPDGAAVMRQALACLTDPARLAHMGGHAAALFERAGGAVARTVEALSTWLPATQSAWRDVRAQHLPNDTLWHDPACFDTITPEHFSLPFWIGRSQPMGTGSGRGQVHTVTHGDRAYVLRHYRRGGLMAKISRDAFWRQPAAASRAMREFTLLRQMRAWGLSVPRPAAARQLRQGLIYRADILVESIPNSRNLAQCLDAHTLDAGVWQAVGRVIRQMHRLGVHHSDLNCHNLLLDNQGRVWIVDFDKCALRPPGEWMQGNLARLLRSLRKEAGRRAPFHWREADWPHLLEGYNAG